MNHSQRFSAIRNLFVCSLAAALLAACGGSNLDPVLGTPGEVVTLPTPTPTVPPVVSDVSRPTVVLTVPAPGASDVLINRKITAAFSENMNPATISSASFTVVNISAANAPVVGVVTYSVEARTATFAPAAFLPLNSQLRATVTAAATDVAGNALAGNSAPLPAASDHVWTFQTGATADTLPPTVQTVSPTDGSVAICRTRAVTATFDEPMDPLSITKAGAFTVTNNNIAVPGLVTYDEPTRQARFVANSAGGFPAGGTFVATVRSGVAGVQDLAGNPLAADKVWGFTTGANECLTGVTLGAIGSFGGFGGGAGMTNQGIQTVVNGDIGSTSVCTSFTGFHDNNNRTFTETLNSNQGYVNGTVYCSPNPNGPPDGLAVATQALAAARAAYDQLVAKPPGGDPFAGALGGRTLFPGVYTAAGGTWSILGSDLTLDAQGDPNAVWVFQGASSLTVSDMTTPVKVLLINGAEARNVYWAVGSKATINQGSVMVGTIIAKAGVVLSTAGTPPITRLTGRAIGLDASSTMVDTVITLPTP